MEVPLDFRFYHCIQFGFISNLGVGGMSVTVSALLGEKTYQIFSISLNATVLDAVNEMNRHYTLAVSDFWLDAKGQPLKSS